jgi:hypothetical protein
LLFHGYFPVGIVLGRIHHPALVDDIRTSAPGECALGLRKTPVAILIQPALADTRPADLAHAEAGRPGSYNDGLGALLYNEWAIRYPGFWSCLGDDIVVGLAARPGGSKVQPDPAK